ncbi:MAG: hypothetical protein Q8R04_02500 [Nanoarchaeota archaeon]|nr:hypothetical protein [Nanoarchaeota archaeon]
MKINSKLVSASILIFTLALLLSTIAYAKPFTDVFKGGLIQINDFFAKEQYKAYAKTIDFFFFSFLFMSIYMMGVKYAFKEVKRPEQAIAILLGLITAFLMVMGGYSIAKLLPFINWFLYFLLFVFFWRLLKGIKSKFWRFILALLLTLLIIALAQMLFGVFTTPDTQGYFKSFTDTFKGVQFGGIQPPRIPESVSNLFGPPPSVTTPSEEIIKETKTPTAGKPDDKKKEETKAGTSATLYSDLPWGKILIGVAALLGIGGAIVGYNRLRQRKKDGEGERQPVIKALNKEIDELIKKKRNSIKAIESAKAAREKYFDKTEEIDEFIERLVQKKGPVYIYEQQGKIKEDWKDFKHIIQIEEELVEELKKLRVIEVDFLVNTLRSWRERAGIPDDVVGDFKFLVDNRAPLREKERLGIRLLILVLYNVAKHAMDIEEDEIGLLEQKNIKELVTDKFNTIANLQVHLSEYYALEDDFIELLKQKIGEQITKLDNLKAGRTPPSEPPPQRASPQPRAPAPRGPATPPAPRAPATPAQVIAAALRRAQRQAGPSPAAPAPPPAAPAPPPPPARPPAPAPSADTARQQTKEGLRRAGQQAERDLDALKNL